jgi:hypothetical protein
MISNMQYPREMYGKGGLTSLKEARNLLEKYALPGESLAYINDEEARFLKYMGGAGIPVNSSGVPSYFVKKLVKKVTKPVAKFLDKIVPNSLKPFLPFLAAAIPFIGPALAPGIMGALTAGQMAAVAAGANAISQLSQEGAAERGLNPLSLGLSALSGYGAGAGNIAKGAATSGNIAGNIPTYNIAANPELAQFGNLTAATTPINAAQLSELGKGFSTIPGIDDLSQVGVSQLPAGFTPPTFLQQVQNVPGNVSEFVGGFTRPGMENLKTIADQPLGDITLGQASKAGITLLPGQSVAAGELAYNAALDAKKKYDEDMARLGVVTSTNIQDRINYIRSAMISAGFTEDEIASAITRSGFQYGGYVGYSKGGIMNLGGMELDYRSKGGFVPIGKKEKADDVPARLSKNEFVFTANAVRGAGKGDIKKGAKKMYQLMRQYEAMA